MDAPQLQRARKALERDQEAWYSKRTELEHQVQEHNIALDALKPRLVANRKKLGGLQVELKQLGEDKQKILAEIVSLEDQRKDTLAANAVLQGDSAELERIITRKRGEIDNGLRDYAATRQTELELSLTDTKTAVEAAKTNLMKLTTEIETKKAQINGLRETAIRAKADATDEIERMSAELDALAKRRPELAATVKQLEGELHRAHLEHDQVAAATQKAKIEHQNYLAYERKSRKILETKDRELQERQAEIDVSSRHLKNQRSFLTPM